MASNLIKIKNKKEILNMNEIEIHPESEVEKLIWENKKILPDISLLSRQVPSYTGSDIMDILGLDNDNNIVIIEVKDEEVDENVISQVMRYAFWVETNPDSVKSLWYEKKENLEEIKFDWSKNINIRILIVGPSFNQDVRKLISRVKYKIELIELKKFNDGEEDYIFVNQIAEHERSPHKASTLRYTGEYGEDFYKSQRNPNSVPGFLKVAEMMEGHIKKKGWNLTRSNNKNYISFKYGFPIICGVEWFGSKSFGVFFKVSKIDADRIKLKGDNFIKYEYSEQWNQIDYKVNSVNFKMEDLDELFEAAYKNIVGK